MNLCTGCLKVFKKYQLEIINQRYTVAYCPECNEKIVEVDELITPTIIELNKKGWTTEYCCSGHLYDDSDDIDFIHTYIKFTHMPLTLPVGFYRDYDCIRVKNPYRKLEGIQGFNTLIGINRNLYKWALGLPNKDLLFNKKQ